MENHNDRYPASLPNDSSLSYEDRLMRAQMAWIERKYGPAADEAIRRRTQKSGKVREAKAEAKKHFWFWLILTWLFGMSSKGSTVTGALAMQSGIDYWRAGHPAKKHSLLNNIVFWTVCGGLLLFALCAAIAYGNTKSSIGN